MCCGGGGGRKGSGFRIQVRFATGQSHTTAVGERGEPGRVKSERRENYQLQRTANYRGFGELRVKRTDSLPPPPTSARGKHRVCARACAAARSGGAWGGWRPWLRGRAPGPLRSPRRRKAGKGRVSRPAEGAGGRAPAPAPAPPGFYSKHSRHPRGIGLNAQVAFRVEGSRWGHR